MSIQCKYNPIVMIHFRCTIIAQYNNPSDDVSEFSPADNLSSHPIEEAACLKSLLAWEVHSVGIEFKYMIYGSIYMGSGRCVLVFSLLVIYYDVQDNSFCCLVLECCALSCYWRFGRNL